MSRLAIHAACLLLSLAMPAAALAQTQTPDAGTPHADALGADATLPKSMSADIEQHIARLHDQLAITPAEQPQWEQFAQVMRDNAAKMNRIVSKRTARMGTMDAAESMQSYAMLAQTHATNMQKLASSFQSLYAIFPDPQKQIATAVFRNSNGRVTPRKH